MSGQITFESFCGPIRPSAALGPALLALWYDGQGDWDKAHALAQQAGNRDGDWVHAYLHRKEGDATNAAYWYGRAGKPVSDGELHAEWETIARELLGRADGG